MPRPRCLSFARSYWGCALLACALWWLWPATPAAAQTSPRQMGIIVPTPAPLTGPGAIPPGHSYADALAAGLAASDELAVALLYERSPLVVSRRVQFPAVGPPEEWSALAPLLAELAGQLQLDYILVTCLWPPAAGDEGNSVSVQGVVVVRGNGSHRIVFNETETDPAKLVTAASHGMARRVVTAIRSKLPPPAAAAEEEAVPVEVRPAEQERPEEQPVTPPVEQPAETPEEAAQPPAEEPGPVGPEAGPTRADAPAGGSAFDAALAAFERGDYDAASVALRRALEEQGASGELYLLRARIDLARHDEEAALKDLHSAVGASPDLVEARIRLARLLDGRGLWQDAVKQYRAALAIEPGNVEALLGLAGVYRDNGHRRKAISLLEEARPTHPSPEDVTLLVALADLHATGPAEGRLQAEAVYLRALALSGGEGAASILEHLGDLYLKLHRHRDALKCYAQAADPALGGSIRTSMVKRRYQEVMRAADTTVREELDGTWRTLQDYVRDGLGEREQVVARMTAYQHHLEEAISFASSVVPPASLKTQHAQRQLAYSLALEGTVAALAYLDLGGDDLLQRAQQRRDDALAELADLGAGN